MDRFVVGQLARVLENALATGFVLLFLLLQSTGTDLHSTSIYHPFGLFGKPSLLELIQADVQAVSKTWSLATTSVDICHCQSQWLGPFGFALALALFHCLHVSFLLGCHSCWARICLSIAAKLPADATLFQLCAAMDGFPSIPIESIHRTLVDTFSHLLAPLLSLSSSFSPSFFIIFSMARFYRS